MRPSVLLIDEIHEIILNEGLNSQLQLSIRLNQIITVLPGCRENNLLSDEINNLKMQNLELRLHSCWVRTVALKCHDNEGYLRG